MWSSCIAQCPMMPSLGAYHIESIQKIDTTPSQGTILLPSAALPPSDRPATAVNIPSSDPSAPQSPKEIKEGHIHVLQEELVRPVGSFKPTSLAPPHPTPHPPIPPTHSSSTYPSPYPHRSSSTPSPRAQPAQRSSDVPLPRPQSSHMYRYS